LSSGEYIPESSTYGNRAAGVPGTVAGLAYALAKYGTLKWADVAEPARRLAADGFPVWHTLASSLNGASRSLSRYPETKRIFLRDGKPYSDGEIFKQPELAQTFARMIKGGWREFTGQTAEHVAVMKRSDAAHPWMTPISSELPRFEREPLRSSYRGYEIAPRRHLLAA
jgi:gamma-glutamyltranspeptidase/glutathione hydrolase